LQRSQGEVEVVGAAQGDAVAVEDERQWQAALNGYFEDRGTAEIVGLAESQDEPQHSHCLRDKQKKLRTVDEMQKQVEVGCHEDKKSEGKKPSSNSSKKGSYVQQRAAGFGKTTKLPKR
jgi:hypothetical protein